MADEVVRGADEVVVGEHEREEWDVAYDLADDQETIDAVQRATLTTKDFGLVPEVALYGSEGWWAAIADGRIPRHEARGIISRMFMSGHGDWPELEIEGDGVKTRWTRSGNQALYVVGREAKVEYVLQKPRKKWQGEGEQKVVLRILVKREGQRYSESTRKALEDAGWFHGRTLPRQASAWIRRLDRPGGFDVFPAAESVLTEFGGLRVGASGPGVECARTSFEVDPTLALGEEDRFQACASRLGVRLYPLGEVGGGAAFMAIAEDGRVFLLMDVALCVVSSFHEAVESLVEGKRWSQMEEGP